MATQAPVELRDPFRLERARIPKVHEAIRHVELDAVTLHFIEPANRAAFGTGDAHVRRVILLAPVLIPDFWAPLLGYVCVAFGTGNSVHILFRRNGEARSSIDAAHVKPALNIARLHLE